MALSLKPLWCTKNRMSRAQATPAFLASFPCCVQLPVKPQKRCPQPCDPELDWGILPDSWEDALPTISWPHSRWLDSCSAWPVVSIGSAHEAMAARRQQQQYTDRARYTDDSNITCKIKPAGKQSVSLCCDILTFDDWRVLPVQQKV